MIRILTPSEYEAFKEAVAPNIAEWLAHPVTMVIFNGIRQIPSDAASSPNATASEQALSVVGATRMREAVLSCILDPTILLTPSKQIEVPEADYQTRKGDK